MPTIKIPLNLINKQLLPQLEKKPYSVQLKQAYIQYEIKSHGFRDLYWPILQQDIKSKNSIYNTPFYKIDYDQKPFLMVKLNYKSQLLKIQELLKQANLAEIDLIQKGQLIQVNITNYLKNAHRALNPEEFIKYLILRFCFFLSPIINFKPQFFIKVNLKQKDRDLIYSQNDFDKLVITNLDSIDIYCSNTLIKHLNNCFNQELTNSSYLIPKDMFSYKDYFSLLINYLELEKSIPAANSSKNVELNNTSVSLMLKSLNYNYNNYCKIGSNKNYNISLINPLGKKYQSYYPDITKKIIQNLTSSYIKSKGYTFEKDYMCIWLKKENHPDDSLYLKNFFSYYFNQNYENREISKRYIGELTGFDLNVILKDNLPIVKYYTNKKYTFIMIKTELLNN